MKIRSKDGKSMAKAFAQTDTVFGAKFAEKGILAINVKLQLAIAEFQNNGGTYGVAIAMINAAYGKGSAAIGSVPKGQARTAETPPTIEGMGQASTAEKATLSVPLPSTPSDAVGQSMLADKALQIVPRVRSNPGHAKRGATVISSIQSTLAKSLFDHKLPDGRALRDVAWSELPNLSKRYRDLSRVFTLLHKHAVPADPNTPVDQLINEDGLRSIFDTAEKFNDIH